MIRPPKEIIRHIRPLLTHKNTSLISILTVGKNLLVPEESDEVVSAEVRDIANKLISDATLEIANRN